jgi:hypothetical protein
VCDAQEDARIILGGALEGHIEPKPLGPADVHPGRAWFGRGWTGRCYEECEIWPEASEGEVGPLVPDDPPGRISKRGYWAQFDTSQWPGSESAER